MELSNKKRKTDKTDNNKDYVRQKKPDRKEHIVL